MLTALLSLALQVENLERFGGSPEARKVLLERGFVVTDERRRQICSFYIHSDAVFITTDALLYAYYVNLEKGVLALESRQAARLGKLLDTLAGTLAAFRKKDLAPLWAEAAARLDLYLTVARALASGSTSDADLARLPEKAAEEIRLVLKAERPAASPLRGITLDYPRFAPRGLYAGRPALERFARAATWLREVPFRVVDEKETREAVLLVRACAEDAGNEIPWDLKEFNDPYERLLGPPEDPGLYDFHQFLSAVHTSMLAGSLDDGSKARAELLEAVKAPRLSATPTAEAQLSPATTRGLRLLPRPISADVRVFGALAPAGRRADLPSGEELMAVLGSPLAKDLLELPADLLDAAAKERADAEKEHRDPVARAGRRLYRTLLAPEIPEGAPAWYRHAGWRAKDLNTALAGWAHERMIWDVTGARNAAYGGLTQPPPGLIEPNPAFFDALLDLTLRMDDFLRPFDVTAPRFPRLALLLREVSQALRRQLDGKEFLPEDRALLGSFGPRLGNVCGFDGNSWLSDMGLPDTSFHVSVGFEITRGIERIVGQGRPRAIYVVSEHKGRRYVAMGGALSYRDVVAPAAGPERMTAERWRAAPPPAPRWTSRFAVDFSAAELHQALEEGRVLDQMFERPDKTMGEILARKLAAREPFEGRRRDAVRLFAKLDHPRLVETLLPLLQRPIIDHHSLSFRSWPEAEALDGRLKPEHFHVFQTWFADNHPEAIPLLGLAATIQDEATRDRVLDALDLPPFQARKDLTAVFEELVRPPGLRMSRKIFAKMPQYPELVRRTAGEALAERWTSGDFTAEEVEFRAKLLVMLASLGLKMK